MKTKSTFISFLVAGLVSILSPSATAAEPKANDWTYDASIYGLAAGMSGDVSIGPITADVNLSFDKILDNLEMAAMGSFRIGRGNWALTTDLVYMGLGASKKGVTVDMDQLVFEPMVSHRFNERFELLAGARFNDIAVTVRGPGVIADSGIREADESWWDAIIGANLSISLSKDLAFVLRADIGMGGSDLTWQALPGVSWQFSPRGTLQAGYRWVYTDYETGSGGNYFHYDMLTQGPQVGVRFRF